METFKWGRLLLALFAVCLIAALFAENCAARLGQ
jgi:hypothetical protein